MYLILVLGLIAHNAEGLYAVWVFEKLLLVVHSIAH
jgi:hypothetical protein